MPSPLARLWTRLLPEFRQMGKTPVFRIIGAIFTIYTLAAFGMFYAKGIHLSLFAWITILLQPVGITLFGLLYLGWPKTLRDRLSRLYKSEFAVSGLVLTILTMTFLSVYLTVKMNITQFVPFWADDMLMDLDRRLHFGHTPWRLISPLFSHAAVLYVTDALYTFWLAVNVYVILWQAFKAKNAELRAAYFLNFFFVWTVLGTLIALAASSAGPCYFGHVSTLPNPYDAQMALLNRMHESFGLNALGFQSALWENHLAAKSSLVNGISACPSIHVAMATVYALLGRHYGRAVRWSGYGFFIVILLGSVALNWHYAVDAYFSMISAPLIWWFSNWAVRRYKLATPRA